jgi:exodeoxyribonuclease-5
MTNLYNGGVRARVLYKEEDLSNGDRIMVTKNNYFWAKEYEDLEFIANGDMFEIQRLTNRHELYGFQFATASLRSVDYNWEIEALVWIDTLMTDSPEANYTLRKTIRRYATRKNSLRRSTNPPITMRYRYVLLIV